MVFIILPCLDDVQNSKITLKNPSVDSMLLIEEGFDVVSIDASEKMLKYALRERAKRQNEAGFNRWSKNCWIFFH